MQTEIPSIPTIKNVTRFSDVLVPHAGEAFYALCESGLRWVAKGASQADVTAESLGWFAANHLGAPTVRRVGVARAGALLWLSGLIDGVSDWRPQDISAIVNPEGLGRMMVLDIFIGNEDRHARNLLIEPVGGAPSVVAIDMAAARIGNPGMLNPLRVHDVSRLAGGIDSRVIAHGLHCGVAALQAADDELIHRWCVAAGHAADLQDDRVDQMCDVLIARRDACPNLVCQFVKDLDQRATS